MKMLLVVAAIGCGNRADPETASTVQVELSTICNLTGELVIRQDGLRSEILYEVRRPNDHATWFTAEEKVRILVRGLNEMRQASSSMVTQLARSDARLGKLGKLALGVMGDGVGPPRRPFDVASIQAVFDKLHTQERALDLECKRVLAMAEPH